MAAENNHYKIYLSPPHLGGDEEAYLRRALESGWLAPGGPMVDEFEGKLKELTGRAHCVALNSGTAAIHLALLALGIGPGDHVICQTFSFVASANPVAYVGAVPVFVDSEPDTWNMDPELLEQAVLDLGKKSIIPKAIIYTHIFGNPAKVDELRAIAEKHDIPLIEDAAEALGATHMGRPAGAHGKISIFSFNGNKVITTSGGGALLTDDRQIASRVLHLANQARSWIRPYEHDGIGYNYRMSNISAALGLAQFRHLKKWIDRKRDIFESYKEINEKKTVFSWPSNQPDKKSSYWLSAFLLPSHEIREKMIETLHEHKIEARRFWKPLHNLNLYENQVSYLKGVADHLFTLGICLPCGAGLQKDEQRLIKDTLIAVL